MMLPGALCLFLFVGQDGFSVPPYLRTLGPDSVQIAWEPEHPGQQSRVRLKEVSGTGRPLVRTIGPGRGLRVQVFDHLRPGTLYEYSVRVGGGPWQGGRFRTLRNPAGEFSFLVFGDTRHDVDVHRAMIELMAAEGAAFALHTGDIVQRADAELFRRFFRIEWPLLSRMPLYPALGNHELSGSWNTGRGLFRGYFALPGRGPGPGVCYSFVYGNSLFMFLDTNVEISGSRQEAWAISKLVETATDPNVQHVFVVVHHGPAASGPHGPNWDLATSDLFEAFQRFGVDIIFAGHDHLYERGRLDRLWYVVTAGGGAPLYPVRRVMPTTDVVESTYHYVLVRVRGPEVEVSARRLDGSLLDWFYYVKTSQGATLASESASAISGGGHDARPQVLVGRPGVGPERHSRGHPSSKRAQRGWVLWVAALLGMVGTALGAFVYLRRRG